MGSSIVVFVGGGMGVFSGNFCNGVGVLCYIYFV